MVRVVFLELGGVKLIEQTLVILGQPPDLDAHLTLVRLPFQIDQHGNAGSVAIGDLLGFDHDPFGCLAQNGFLALRPHGAQSVRVQSAGQR